MSDKQLRESGKKLYPAWFSRHLSAAMHCGYLFISFPQVTVSCG
jgi:hypothetical protein